MTFHNVPRPIELTYTNTVVSVTTASTLIVSANANRRYLCLRRGAEIGRMFVLFGSGTATTTNGELMRENEYIESAPFEYFTGEVNAICNSGSKNLYVTEGFVV